MSLASLHLQRPVSPFKEGSAFPLSTSPILALLPASLGGRPANTCHGMNSNNNNLFQFHNKFNKISLSFRLLRLMSVSLTEICLTSFNHIYSGRS